MRSLIAIAVYDTDDNKRTEYTIKTYESVTRTIFDDTQVCFIDNDSCLRTKEFLKSVQSGDLKVDVITNTSNIGTAEAINKAWYKYKDIPYKIKLDNDVVFHEPGWVEDMIRCFELNPEIGILGLKRKDLPNEPSSESYPTKLAYLNHSLGDKWDFKNVVEYCEDIIGTCLMFNPELFNKIGYLYQPGSYGFDDVLACARSLKAGFRNAFYPSVEIDHIDTGETVYADWKRKYAGVYLPKIGGIISEYSSGEKSIHYNPFENNQ
jgi:GT2 family glycosyltransferase